MTYQPGEQPSYTPPQDPWSGTQGVASAPTDPIPAPARGQFAPGVASPSAPAPVVWQQETITHDPYRRGRSRAGLYVFVVILVLVLGGGGGYGAWWAITKYFPTPTDDPSGSGTSNGVSTSPSTSSSPTPTDPSLTRFDPSKVAVGTCLVNLEPDPTKRPDMYIAPCDREDAFKVLRIRSGEEIPETEDGEFTREITADPVCEGLAWDAFFGLNSENDAMDYFYCLDDFSRP